MTLWVKPVTLQSNRVLLRPMGMDDTPAMAKATEDGKLWELFFTPLATPETMQEYVAAALADKEKGLQEPFVVVDRATNTVVGSTRYLNIASAHKRLEIGATWYAESVQRTGVNTECKLLLLTHAFEELKANVVEFRTDWFNHKSRTAIARLGAKQDGVLRNHTTMATNGRVRDVVVFSIIVSEWPGVKQNIQYLIAKHR